GSRRLLPQRIHARCRLANAATDSQHSGRDRHLRTTHRPLPRVQPVCNHNSYAPSHGPLEILVSPGMRQAAVAGDVHPPQRRSKTMRRNRLTSIGVLTCGLVLAAGATLGVTPAGAASSSTDLQTTLQAVQNAAAGAVAGATGTAAPTAPGPASDPLPSAPVSAAAPLTVVTNELGEAAP